VTPPGGYQQSGFKQGPDDDSSFGKEIGSRLRRFRDSIRAGRDRMMKKKNRTAQGNGTSRKTMVKMDHSV
jgi:hypothetical protein